LFRLLLRADFYYQTTFRGELIKAQLMSPWFVLPSLAKPGLFQRQRHEREPKSHSADKSRTERDFF